MNNKSTENPILFSEIALLMSVHAEESLFWYTAALKKLAVSDNFKVRANAIQTLSNLGMADEIPTPPARELGIGFTLHLPADEKFRHVEKVNPYENIQDTDDYMKVISSHQGWLDFLAEETGLAKENIAHRWITLMNEKVEPNQTSQVYEKEVQQHLKKLLLDFPFQRPRIEAVEIGLDYLLPELIDSGKLDISSVWPYHKIDPALEKKIIIEQRPEFVLRLTDTASRYVGEEWVDQIDSHKRLKEGILNYGDSTVIAEYYYFLQISWGKPSEIFSSYCRINNRSLAKSAKHDNIIIDCNYEEYHDLEGLANAHLTVSHQSNFNFHIGYLSRWIAFNPVVARDLEWIPSTKANFAWENESGDLMSHSVFWRSGNIYMAPPGKDSESAEGWYVLLTKKGAEDLKKVGADITIVKDIKRDWYYERPKSRKISIEISSTI